MKTIKNIVAVTALTLASFSGFAQSVTASGTTLDAAEAQIAAKAKQLGSSYKITSARFTNRAEMSAELVK